MTGESSLAAALLVLAGVRRGSRSRSAGRPEPGTSRSPCAGRYAPVIVAFGDSLTEGFGVDPAHSYPDFLQRETGRRGYRTAWSTRG